MGIYAPKAKGQRRNEDYGGPMNYSLRIPALFALCSICWLGRMIGEEASQARVEQTHYYVSPEGDDLAAGSQAAPFRTLGRAITIAGPGDTVFIRQGVYREGVVLRRGGNPEAYLTIRNFPGETPLFEGGWTWSASQSPGVPGLDVAIAIAPSDAEALDVGYVRIQGLVIRYYKRAGIDLGWYPGQQDGSYVCKTRNIEVRFCVVDQCGQKGISASYCEDIVFENNLTSRNGDFDGYDSWSSGLNFIYMRGKQNVLRGNVSFHNVDIKGIPGKSPPMLTDGNGAIVDTSFGNGEFLVANNLLFENGGAGVVLTKSSNVTLQNNTCYNNDRHNPKGNSYDFWGDEAYRNIVLSGNIGWQPGHRSAIGATQPFQGGSRENNYLDGDPGFQDVETANFRLGPSSSLRGGASRGGYRTPQGIGFDHRAITREDLSNRKAFWRFSPDIEYIRRKGGLEHCFSPRDRRDSADPGAYQAGE